MKQTFTRILMLTVLSISVASPQNQKETQTQSENYENGNGFENNQNRLPQLLRDVKILL